MNIKHFFTKQYLFEIDRVLVHKTDKALGFLGAALIVLGLVFKLAALYAPSPVDAKYRGKFFTLFFSIGLSEVIWYGFRVEYVTFFGSHLVAFLILLTGLIWFVVLVVKMIKNYSKEKQEWEKQQVRQKYLPNN
jgi:hypothetical protein